MHKDQRKLKSINNSSQSSLEKMPTLDSILENTKTLQQGKVSLWVASNVSLDLDVPNIRHHSQ